MQSVANAASRGRNERGAVIVMVAIWLPLLALFVSFAVDVAHFFDYSRNLQNRADAAALAAGDAYGSTCFGSPTGPQLDSIGLTAQQYAGPPVPPGGTYPAGNLPYPYGSVTGNYQNQPNLKKGTYDKFFMVLNGAKSAADGGTSFTDGTFCSADYTNPAGPAVDVWLSQKNLPLFFPMLGFTPNISAHARVSLQGEASSPFLRPLAVSDPGAFGCASVIFRSSKDNSIIATRALDETDPTNFKFDNSANPVAVPIPNDSNGSGANVYVYMQVVLSDCNGNGETFDDSTNSGIDVINSFDTAGPGSGPPKITAGGVTLCQAGSGNQNCAAVQTCDPYFSTGGCTDNITAHVTFNSTVTNPNAQASVTATDLSTGATRNLSPDAAGTTWTPNQTFPIADSTGQHLFRIDWSQKNGSISGTNCTGGNPCTGSFGIQQQAFGGCNGCDQPDDSGPTISAQICNSVTGACDTNAYQQTSVANPAPSLVVKLQLAGIRAQVSSNTPAPVTIMRFSGTTNHQTGLVDCGQGNQTGGAGTSADAYTIYGGCGPSNPFEAGNQCGAASPPCPLNLMNPLYVYGRGNPINCSPAADQDYTDWPSLNHQDCVQTTPGSRRVSIVCGLLQRITGVTPANFSASSNACNSNFGGACPTNNWGSTIQAGDPRIVDVVLVAPADLAAADGTPQAWIPIRKMASFYVTGWDPSLFPNCGTGGAPNNDTFPGKGKQSANGAIWGHWFSDSENGTPDGNSCNLNSIEPLNCVPALTR